MYYNFTQYYVMKHTYIHIFIYLDIIIIFSAFYRTSRFLCMNVIQGLSKRFERFKFGIFYLLIVKIDTVSHISNVSVQVYLPI